MNRDVNYQFVVQRLVARTDGIPYETANLANASALLWQYLPDINWAGFYKLVSDDLLVLGPFQGKPACVEIKVGKGVCGRAVARDEVILVEDVHEFAGHIACDEASNSEIVLPIHVKNMVVAVLDVDSPLIARFDEEDKEGLLEVVHVIEEMLVHSGNCLL